MGFIDRPHQLWIRRAMFQIHLWVGLLLCLYMLALGISGSILVFKEELQEISQAKDTSRRKLSPRTSPLISVSTVIQKAKGKYPEGNVIGLYAPATDESAFTVVVQTPIPQSDKKETISLDADPTTGNILGVQSNPPPSWVDFVRQFHFFLLLGGTGWKLNGYGAVCLFALSLSGLIIWWPGIRNWRRAATVNFKSNWKRIVFDLHGASGLWTLGFLLIWAGTTVTFVWGNEVKALVGKFTPITNSGYPRVKPQTHMTGELTGLEEMLAHAQKNSPTARLKGIDFPGKEDDTLTIYMARGDINRFDTCDYYIFEPATGKELAVWRRGFEPTRGDKLLELMGPLHFGTAWGLPVKILWALAGMVLPLLTITSVFMYWNRYLSKKWRQLRSPEVLQTLELS